MRKKARRIARPFSFDFSWVTRSVTRSFTLQILPGSERYFVFELVVRRFTVAGARGCELPGALGAAVSVSVPVVRTIFAGITAICAIEHLHDADDNLGGFALFAFFRLVRADRETPVDENAHPFLEIRVAGFCKLVPSDAVDEISLFLLLGATVHRESEFANGGAAVDVTDLGIADQIAYQGDSIK